MTRAGGGDAATPDAAGAAGVSATAVTRIRASRALSDMLAPTWWWCCGLTARAQTLHPANARGLPLAASDAARVALAVPAAQSVASCERLVSQRKTPSLTASRPDGQEPCWPSTCEHPA